jgi:nucleotide-binding universal stress UspA family protein
MTEIKTILVPTDFRKSVEEITNVASQLAWVFEARLFLLHVAEPTPPWPMVSQEMREEAELRLSEYAAEFAAKHVAIAGLRVVGGSVAGRIARIAREEDADLILMSAGGTSKLGHYRPGRVADTVLSMAIPPVLVIRPGSHRKAFHSILCSVDMSEASHLALLHAVNWARRLGVHLSVLTVMPEVGWLSAVMRTGQMTGAQEAYERLWQEEFDRLLEGTEFHGVSWERQFRRGKPPTQILEAAKQSQADLIVMGSSGRTGLARMVLGSTTQWVFEHLPCSLLVVKAEQELALQPTGTSRTDERL